LETAAFVASRLTVVISQSAAGQAHYTEMEEALLAELMMTAGLDATLVGPLERVQVDSTDYLCLSGFAQSIALVSAIPAEAVAQHWKRLALPGQVLPVGQEQPSRERRVYFLPLELGVLLIIEQLKQLLADRNVRTVGLSLPLVSKSGAAVGVSQSSVAGMEAIEPIPVKQPPVGVRPRGSSDTVPAESSGADLRGAPMLQPESYDLEWPNLDQLVDDFDALDL